MYTPADSFYFSNGTNITARRLSKPGAVTLVGAVATVCLCGSSTQRVYTVGMFVQS